MQLMADVLEIKLLIFGSIYCTSRSGNSNFESWLYTCLKYFGDLRLGIIVFFDNTIVTGTVSRGLLN